MNKYIIELDEDAKAIQSISITSLGNIYVDSWYVESLEELNSDYINEHFGDLQDTAYQRGLKDGRNEAWEAVRKIVLNPDKGGASLQDLCAIFGNNASMPYICRHYSASEAIAKLKAYEEKQKADEEIKVGDEVVDKDGDKTIVTNIHGDLFDGLCSDGSTMTDLFLDDNHKTGRHFDIKGILEAMKHD